MSDTRDIVQYNPGDTLLSSKPFSFVIFSSHRYNKLK